MKISWFGKMIEAVPGARHHSSGEATAPKILSRRDGLVHLQDPFFLKNGLAYCRCRLRYNIYKRNGMRGFKGIPTDAPVTCMVCLVLEDS